MLYQRKYHLLQFTFHTNLTLFSTCVFNGKEKDYESGFHYYGSRYYSSEISMWLSTDPMADKYPSLSPYNYCANNPIKLIDPNGEEIWLTDDEGNKQSLLTLDSFKKDAHDRRVEIIKQIYDSGKEGRSLVTELMAGEISISILPRSEGYKEGMVLPSLKVYWGEGDDVHGGSDSHILAEELFHCKQIKDHQWNFYDMSREKLLSLEVDAKEFSARIFPSFNKYFQTQGYYVPTEMNIMSSGYDKDFKINYLNKDRTTILPKYRTEPMPFERNTKNNGTYNHKGAY
ncbi:MAG: RHS repeat-associated core domain-containing protein [Clostridia bacterium]|nr:RHS repeat-associated core domain-containing protein [Clostridia bacterium]